MKINETEPVSLSGAVGLVLSTGVALVALLWPNHLSAEQQAGIVAFGNAVIWLGAIYFGRKGSTPIAAPVLNPGTSVTLPNGAPATVVPTEGA